VWHVDVDALESIAIGAGILGTGGGGNPYIGKLRARRLLEQGLRVVVVDPTEVADDAFVASVGGMGAPTVGIEKFEKGDEAYAALRALERHAGVRVEALIPGEIGGGNSIEPMIVAGLTGLPVVDADGMGRAFPELQMVTFLIYGVSPTPAALADEKGNRLVFDGVKDARWLERIARVATIEMGGAAGLAFSLMRGSEMRRTAIPNTLSLARRVGQAVRSARNQRLDPIAAVLRETRGRVLFCGKIVDVERWTTGGFARGQVRLAGSDEYIAQELTIDFQNENLIARIDGEVVASVPDLICVLDSADGEPITTEMLRYGFRVCVVGLPAPRELCTEQALSVVGPRAFGYEVEFRPLEVAPH
jgi:DUF917 family protein